MLRKLTAGSPARMESPAKMGRGKKSCILTSQASISEDKRIEVNRVGVGLGPAENLKHSKPRSCLSAVRSTGVVSAS
jgi:hypothetical protein